MHFFVNRLSFCWQGFTCKFVFFTIFYHMVPFFQVWSIKQVLALYLFSASANYRVKWINNAAVIVRVCVRMLVYA